MNLFYFYRCSLVSSYSTHIVSLLFPCPYLFTYFNFFITGNTTIGEERNEEEEEEEKEEKEKEEERKKKKVSDEV